MSSPPLIGRLPAQEARSYAAGPSRPQAPIQRRQRLIHELRLCTLVNLSWSATQPATGELAVAQPTTVFINRIVRGPESGRRSAITSYLDIQIIQRDDVALRARRVSAPIKMVQSSEPRVAPSRRSKLALTSRGPTRWNRTSFLNCWIIFQRGTSLNCQTRLWIHHRAVFRSLVPPIGADQSIDKTPRACCLSASLSIFAKTKCQNTSLPRKS